MALAIGLGVAGAACADTYLGEMPRSACAANGGYSDSTITSRDNNDPVASCYKQTPSWTPPPIVAPRPPPRTVMVPRTTTVTHTYRTVTVTPRTYAPTSSQVLQQNLGTLSNAIGIMGAFAAERAQQREAEQAEQQADEAAREEQRRQQEEEAAAAAKAADDAGRDAMSNSFEPATNVADTSNPFNALKFDDSQGPKPSLDLAANARTPEEAEMLQPGGPPTPVQPMGLDSPENRADVDATVAGAKAELYPPSPTGTDSGAAEPTPAATTDPGAAVSQSGPAKSEIYGPPAPGETTPGAVAQPGAQAQAQTQTEVAATPTQINPTTQGGQLPPIARPPSEPSQSSAQTPPGPVETASNAGAATSSVNQITTATSTSSPQPEIYGPPLPPPTTTTGPEKTAPSTPPTPQEQLALDVIKNNPGLGASPAPTETTGFGGEKSKPLPVSPPPSQGGPVPTSNGDFGAQPRDTTSPIETAPTPTATSEAVSRPTELAINTAANTDPNLIPEPPPPLPSTPAPRLPPRPLIALRTMASDLPPALLAQCLAWRQNYDQAVHNSQTIVSIGTSPDPASIGAAGTVQHDSYVADANNNATAFNSRCAGP